MKSAVAVIAINILLMGSVAAQGVHIKESTIITPRQAKEVRVAYNSNKFHIEVTETSPAAIQMRVQGTCTDTVLGGPGPTLVADIMPVKSGDYWFTLSLCGPLTDTETVGVFFDDSTLFYQTHIGEYWIDGCFPMDEFWNGHFRTPYFSTFDFSLGAHQLMSGDFAGINLLGKDDCESSTWYSDDPVSFTIVSGSQYASFHGAGSQVSLGPSITTTGDDAGQYSLVADGSTPDSSGDWVTVQAVSDGITRTDSVQVCEALDRLFVNFEPDTIMHQSSATIYVQAKSSAGNDIVIPGSTLFYITADDSGKYGEVEEDWASNPSYLYSDVSRGSVVYNSDGEYPCNMQQVAVTVTDADNPSKSGVANLFIEGDIVVQVVPSVISPGDTASIIVQHRNPDGSLTDFSPGQSFEVGIDSGSAYGTILTSGGTGGYFSSASQPFQFIAADSINADSVMVGIRVGYQPAIASSTAPGSKGSAGQSMKAKPSAISTSVANSGLKSSANKVSTATKGRKSVSDENSFTAPDYGIGYVTVTGGNQLEVHYPTDDQPITGDNPPKMPKPQIKAQLHYPINIAVTYNWEISIKWKSTVNNWTTPRNSDETYSGTESGRTNTWTDLKVNLDAYTRGGQTVTLKVIASTNQGTASKSFEETFEIKGTNPTFANMLAALNGLQYEAIACYESSFNQFAKGTGAQCVQTPNYPLQGVDPSDFGIMQINNPKQYSNCDDIIWNWTVNVQTGKSYFDQCYSDAVTYHLTYDDPSGTAKNTPLDDNQKLKEAYCEYNGGATGAWYWDWEQGDPWHNLPGTWQRSTDGNERIKKARNYADIVFNLYVTHPWR